MTERTAINFPQNNMDLSGAHSIDVPVRAVLHLCTCPDPMAYSGQVIVAADFARENRLF
jgi:hypothetical protein